MNVVTVICRKATKRDVEALYEMIQSYAEQGIMLPRSRQALSEQIDSFVVAEADGCLIGCGSLTRLGHDLVEIRSLGVGENHKRQGIGKKLVERLVEEAAFLQVEKVMALTYAVPFFLSMGFDIVSKEIFPEKVWRDCVHCKKQHCCDEIAVLKRLN